MVKEDVIRELGMRALEDRNSQVQEVRGKQLAPGMQGGLVPSLVEEADTHRDQPIRTE